MIKVLQVISSLHRHGTETAVMNIYKNINRQDIQFDFLVFNDQDMDYLEEINSLGGKVYTIPGRRNGFIRYIKGVRSFFKKNSNEYNVVHLNFCYISTLIPYLYAWKYQIPKRISHSHSSNYVGGWYNLFLHKIFKPFAAILSTDYLACSDLAGKWFFENTIAENHYIILPNGIDTSKFSFNPIFRLKARKELGITDELVLGHIGYFTPVKNHMFLIRIFEHIIHHNSLAKLLLIGSGGDLELETKLYVMQKGLDKKVIFLGKRSDVSFLLQAIDIFVLPSLFEGLPLSLIEAQAVGLKVVTSDTVSQETKITDNISFLPLSAGAETWANHILSKIPYEREEQKDKIYSAGFSIEYAVDILTKLYKNTTVL